MIKFHNLYDAQQLMRCPLCKEVFHFSRQSQTTSDKKIHRFVNNLMGLEDSVKFVISKLIMTSDDD
ncbi:hypothetical protein BpHYR1_017431 [Brachionus plicatilis]|uniref:Uncharacterized protein n=1 Tax=Brachionus plicatilis TaxID=10195 RepID=A0A3M7SJ53_BRAPC|nr:hypothetical protein BpHYR1_017431 [Brachionus plicatilis]